MKPLDEPIGLRVIGGCPESMRTEYFHEAAPQVGLELTASVSGNSGWSAKLRMCERLSPLEYLAMAVLPAIL